jgi:chromosome segregation ATPase
MANIADTLDRLSSLVVEFPERLNTIISESEAVEQQAQDLMENARQKQENVSQILEEVQAAMNEMREETSTRQSDLESEIAEFENSASNLTTFLEVAQETLGNEVENTQTRFEQLQTKIQEGRSQTDSAEDETRTTFDEARDSLDSNQEKLNTAMGATIEKIGALRDKLEAAQKTTGDEVNNFNNEVQRNQDEVNDKINAMVSEFVTLADNFKANLEEMKGSLESNGNAMRETQSQSQEELAQVLESGTQELIGSLGSMTQIISDSEEDAISVRSAIEPLIDRLSDLIGVSEDKATATYETAERIEAENEEKSNIAESVAIGAVTANPMLGVVNYATGGAVSDVVEDGIDEIKSWSPW